MRRAGAGGLRIQPSCPRPTTLRSPSPRANSTWSGKSASGSGVGADGIFRSRHSFGRRTASSRSKPRWRSRTTASGYYEALGASDRLAEATPFVEFMLTIIRETLDAAPVSDQVSDQVKVLLKGFGSDFELSSDELVRRLGLRHKPTFRKNYLNPALLVGVIEMTEPDSPRSPTQRYRLTDVGRRMIAHADAWSMSCAKRFPSPFHPQRRTDSAAP